ncbi:UV radiation resistance associated protein-like, partial [Plakobranchus ocellatus]
MSAHTSDEEFPLLKNPLNLPTYQRRLRHLHGIAVRNLQLPKNQTVDFSKLQVFFTLHKDCKQKALYTSEKITGSLNPTWQSFDLQKCDLDVDLTTKFVVVRIWISHGQASRVKIEANVHLSGLIFFADKLQVVGVKHQPNTVLFGLFGGYFIHLNTSVPNPQLTEWLPDKVIPTDRLPVAAIVDQSTLRPSYNTNSLSRIHTVQRAIKQTQASVRRIHSQLEDKLLSSNENSEKLSEREVLLMKVRQLRHELLWQTQKRQTEQEALESFKAQQDTKLNDIKEKRGRLQNLCKEMEENQSMHIQSKEMLVKENAQVLFRRKQIISEMVQLIYPISEDQKENCYICKVKLPNAENYQ